MITYYTTKEEKQIGHLDCVVRYPDGREEILQNTGHHSPDGFQIGYGGSGPADLAFSILMHFFLSNKISEKGSRDLVFNYYQKFKNDFIVPAKTILCITDIEITKWIGDKGYFKSEKLKALDDGKIE